MGGSREATGESAMGRCTSDTVQGTLFEPYKCMFLLGGMNFEHLYLSEVKWI